MQEAIPKTTEARGMVSAYSTYRSRARDNYLDKEIK